MDLFVVSYRLQAKNMFLQTFNTGKLKITLFCLFSFSQKKIKILLCNVWQVLQQGRFLYHKNQYHGITWNRLYFPVF